MNEQTIKDVYLKDRLDLAFRNMRQGHFALLFLWIIFTLGYFEDVNRLEFLVWSACFIFYIFFSWFVVLNARRHTSASEVQLRRRYILHNLLLGIGWSSSALIARDAANDYLVMLITLGPIFGSVVAVGVLRELMYAWCIPQIVVLVISIYISEELGLLLIFALFASVLGAVLFFAANMDRMFGQIIRYRRENELLLQALEKEYTQTERLSEEKSRFIATASHDLRQPLHAMALLLESADPKQSPDMLKELISKLKRAINNVNQLVSSLLDLSRLDAGTIEPTTRVFALQDLFDELYDEFRVQVSEKDLFLRFVKTRFYVDTDYLLLQRILRNLISNAVRYTKQGGILVGCRRRGEQVVVHVIDSGPGIENGDMIKIFKEYHRNPQEQQTTPEGLGLGLSIVKRLANLLALRLEIESQPGRGSDFSIYLQKATAQDKATIPHTARHGIFESRTVLVIDDDNDVIEAMIDILHKWGCEPIAVTTVEEAESAYAANNRVPEIILADYYLANNINGLQAIERLEKLYQQHIPAVLITADPLAASAQMGSERRIPLLSKPVNPGKLRVVIQHLFRNKQI
ncbi:MAG: hybrid sensor histidine kinase/response regulator [Gammaproteobacteria bacterium]|nr:hybrid sensor histidine kinase/response regulator [Gammaproteobacteria bacterium]